MTLKNNLDAEELYLASENTTETVNSDQIITNAKAVLSANAAQPIMELTSAATYRTANDIHTAHALPLNTWTQSTIECPDDEVWFYFVANDPVAHFNRGSAWYIIETDSHIDTKGKLCDADLQVLGANNDYNDNSDFHIEANLNYGETYYVRVKCEYGITGDFKIRVYSASATEGMSDASTLPLSRWVSGSINTVNKTIWYKFTANAPDAHLLGESGMYTIRTKGDTDVIGYLYNEDEEMLLSNDDFEDAKNFCILYPLNCDQTYYIKVKGVGDAVGRFDIRVDYNINKITTTYIPEKQMAEIRPLTTAREKMIADPIDTHTGAQYLKNDLINLFGGQNICLTAHYDSAHLGDGDFGVGWYHNYEKRLEINEDYAYVYEKPTVYQKYEICEDGLQYNCTSLGRTGYTLYKESELYRLDCNSKRTEYYDTSGRLIKIVDHHGFETHLSYSDTQLIITDTLTNQRLYLHKNTDGKVTRITDDHGRSAILNYLNSYLISVADVNGNFLYYTYDENGRIKTGIDDNSVCFFNNTYDSYGRIVRQQDGEENPASIFVYEENGVRLITNRNGDQSLRVYNDLGLLTSYTDECGNTKTYEYDDNCNITKETDALGKSKTAVFNTFNKPTEITDKNGNTVRYTYDNRGNPLTVSYPDGGIESFVYNDRNQPVQHTDQRGTITVCTYDENGMPATKKVGDRNPIQYVYNSGLLMSETDARGNITNYEYNEMGLMISKTDALNRKTCYEYDGFGNLIKVTDPNGKSTSCFIGCNYLKEHEIDANGNKTVYFYTGNLKLKETTLPDGNTILYRYDGEDRLIKIIDQAGNITTHTYDEAGKCISTTYPDESVIYYSYDAVGNMIMETNPECGVTQKEYDSVGNLKRVHHNYQGDNINYYYDSMSRITRETNTYGSTIYQYNTAGDLLSKTDPLGNKTLYTYDIYGNCLNVKDPGNHTTTFTYDANNNCTSVTDALGNVTRYEYDACNQLIKVTDANGNSTTYTYDACGRRNSVTDAKGNTVQTVYDAMGNVTSVIDAKENVISSTLYNSLNLPTSVMDAAGKITTYQYNALGKVKRIIDPLGQYKLFEYDNRGQNVRVTDPLNGISSATYSALGKTTSLTGPLGGTTEYTYDTLGRMTSESTPSGGKIRYSYNSLHLKSSIINAKDESHHYVYNDLGNIDYCSSPEGISTYAYDACGNILTITDTNGTVARTFDALHRVASYTDTFGKTVQYQYDAVGNLTTLTYPDNTKVLYTYDANNNLVTVTDWANRVTTYTYDANNKVIGITKPDGSVTTIAYDDAQRMISYVDRTAEEEVISGYEYTYDDLSRIIFEKDLAKNWEISYTYDELSRVTQRMICDLNVGTSEEELFTYDAAGNIIGDPENSGSLYDTNNRLITFNNTPITYDADGNMLSVTLDGENLSFGYDSANRLISAGGHVYTYNSENIRIRNLCGEVETTYTYHTNTRMSQLLVRTIENEDTKYIYGLGLIGEENSGNFKTYHYDYRGSTVALTDASGVITDTFEYDTYGKVASRTGTTTTPFLYNGRDGVMTESNGLYYMRARYYSPDLRRFINADIIAGELSDSLTLNRYAYANGNPVSSIDPFGLAKERGDNIYGSIVYNGVEYPIHVPNHLIETDDGQWEVIDKFTKEDNAFDLGKFISSLILDDANGVLNGTNNNMSYVNEGRIGGLYGATFLKTLCDAGYNSTDGTYLDFEFQQKGDQRRVIIGARSNKTQQKYDDISSKNGHVLTGGDIYTDRQLKKLYKKITGEDAKFGQSLLIKMTMDSKHKENPYHSYLFIDAYGNLALSPVIYPNDKVEFLDAKFFSEDEIIAKFTIDYPIYAPDVYKKIFNKSGNISTKTGTIKL